MTEWVSELNFGHKVNSKRCNEDMNKDIVSVAALTLKTCITLCPITNVLFEKKISTRLRKTRPQGVF